MKTFKQVLLICFSFILFLIVLSFYYHSVFIKEEITKIASENKKIFQTNFQVSDYENETKEITSDNSIEYELNNFGANINLPVLKNRQKDAKNSELKYILIWNKAYGKKLFGFKHGREAFYEYLCPETRCVTTDNRNYFNGNLTKFDAIMIHQRGIQWHDMPKQRSPHQYYIHWNTESAAWLMHDIARLNNYFNWTFTYKFTSDFIAYSGQLIKIKEHPVGRNLDTFITEFGKSHIKWAQKSSTSFRAAWFISNCNSKSGREAFAKAMKSHGIIVDIFGKCGNLECSRQKEPSCLEKLNTDYKFYLSFENSICDDYVTEKYFTRLAYNAIPVVFGGANYSAFAPYQSYINAMEFKNAGELVEYMRKVHENDVLFASHFWWREFYDVRINDIENRAQEYCKLCAKLHDPNLQPKIYTNLYKWWVTDSHCRKVGSDHLH